MRHVERELLLDLASKDSKEGCVEKIESIMRGNGQIDWDHLLEYATRHKVTSLCFHGLRPHLDRMIDEGSIPENCVSLMQQQYKKAKLLNAMALDQVARIRREFDKQEIKFVLLKGLTLAQTVYSAHPALRIFSDIDLLIASEDAYAATSVLNNLGYVQGTYNRDTIIAFPKSMLEDTNRLHLHPFLKKGCFAVEVHTKLEVASSPFELPTYDMLSRSQYMNLTPDLRVLSLSVEDGLLYLCVHLSREARLYYPHIQWGNDLRLIKFCDIRGYIRYHRERIDWIKTERLVNAYGLQDPVFYALYHCNTLYPMEEVERFLPRIAPDDMSCLNEFQTRLYQSVRYRWKTADFKERMFGIDRDLEAKQILLENRVETGNVKCPKMASERHCTGTEEEGRIRISESEVADWQPFGTHLQSGVPPKDDSDFSACCRVAWDERHLHLDIEVQDDVVLCTAGDGSGDHLSRDCVRVYFASFDVREDPVVCIMFPTPEHGPNPAFTEHNRNTGACEAIPESAVTCELGQEGYKLHVKLPFAELGIEPDAGRKILFDIEIDDCDLPEEGIKSTLVWSGGGGRNFYDRSVYGTLQFVR